MPKPRNERNKRIKRDVIREIDRGLSVKEATISLEASYESQIQIRHPHLFRDSG